MHYIFFSFSSRVKVQNIFPIFVSLLMGFDSFTCSRQSCVLLCLPNTMVFTLSIKHIPCLFVDIIEANNLVIIKGYDDTTYMTRRTLACMDTRETNDERHDGMYSVKLHC